jgi:hypothetical protein
MSKAPIKKPSRGHTQNQAPNPSPPGAEEIGSQIAQRHTTEGTKQSKQNNSSSEPAWVPIAQGLSAIAALIVAAVIGGINFAQWSVYRHQAKIMMRQLVIARTSARAAERAAKAAQASANAANTQARSAEEANRINREALISTNRPWITFEVNIVPGTPVVFRAENIEATIQVDARNIGRSPATRVNFSVLMFPDIVAAQERLTNINFRAVPMIRQFMGYGTALIPDQEHYFAQIAQTSRQEFIDAPGTVARFACRRT